MARSLIKDSDQAEDLVQHTLISALYSPPKERENLKGWLNTVLRNTARKLGRSTRNRTRRERLVAKGVVQVAPTPACDREPVSAAIAEQIEALKRPYRDVIFLRFFEGLTPNEISKKLNMPLPTVYTNLHRGLAQMRVRLDARFGNRENWVAIFIPVAGFARPGATTVAAASARRLAAIAAVAVLILVPAAVIWVPAGGTATPDAGGAGQQPTAFVDSTEGNSPREQILVEYPALSNPQASAPSGKESEPSQTSSGESEATASTGESPVGAAARKGRSASPGGKDSGAHDLVPLKPIGSDPSAPPHQESKKKYWVRNGGALSKQK